MRLRVRMTRLLRPSARHRRRARLFFDDDWYRERYGLPAEAETFGHYRREGWRQGLDPHPLFDTQWYVAAYGPPAYDASPLEDFAARPTDRRPNRYFDPVPWVRHMSQEREDVVEYLGSLTRGTDDPRLFGDRKGCVLRIVPGEQPLTSGAPVCVYAHYDEQSRVDPHVLGALDALADAGWPTVFCSSSELASHDLPELTRRAAFVLTVANTGLDWGVYHAGLAFVLERFEPAGVTLLNNSVYVDPPRLAAFLDRVLLSDADVVGATDSAELKPHLQSYFLHLPAATVRGALVEELLEHYRPVAEKRYVIAAYEVGFSRRAQELGLRAEAVYSYEALIRGAASDTTEPVNPSRYFWDVLLASGSPFLKVHLFRDRSSDVPDVDKVARLVSPSLADQIRRHIARVGPRSSRW